MHCKRGPEFSCARQPHRSLASRANRQSLQHFMSGGNLNNSCRVDSELAAKIHRCKIESVVQCDRVSNICGCPCMRVCTCEEANIEAPNFRSFGLDALSVGFMMYLHTAYLFTSAGIQLA